MTSSSVLFAGRFQPFHVGHLEVLRSAFGGLQEGQVLVVAAIAPFPRAVGACDAEFLAAAAEHHSLERNPWNLAIRLEAIGALVHELRAEYPGRRVVITPMPRPDYAWSVVELWFPGDRIWVIPTAGEGFDEEKAAFFQRRGDRVLRYDDRSNVSGRALRELWLQRRSAEMAEFIPGPMRAAYLSA